eukprot:gene9693-11901_t
MFAVEKRNTPIRNVQYTKNIFSKRNSLVNESEDDMEIGSDDDEDKENKSSLNNNDDDDNIEIPETDISDDEEEEEEYSNSDSDYMSDDNNDSDYIESDNDDDDTTNKKKKKKSKSNSNNNNVKKKKSSTTTTTTTTKSKNKKSNQSSKTGTGKTSSSKSKNNNELDSNKITNYFTTTTTTPSKKTFVKNKVAGLNGNNIDTSEWTDKNILKSSDNSGSIKPEKNSFLAYQFNSNRSFKNTGGTQRLASTKKKPFQNLNSGPFTFFTNFLYRKNNDDSGPDLLSDHENDGDNNDMGNSQQSSQQSPTNTPKKNNKKEDDILNDIEIQLEKKNKKVLESYNSGDEDDDDDDNDDDDVSKSVKKKRKPSALETQTKSSKPTTSTTSTTTTTTSKTAGSAKTRKLRKGKNFVSDLQNDNNSNSSIFEEDNDDKKTIDDSATESEDSSKTESENEETTKNNVKKFVKNTGKKPVEISNEEDEVEEEKQNRMIDESDMIDQDAPEIERLIFACECFSKRMVNVLANCVPSNIKSDNNNNNNGEKESKKGSFNHKIVNQPKIINNTMRSYQLIGLNWMALLYKENINGILADEMGLGKTVQTISLLAHIYENFKDKGPHIIVVPATTLSNWERELTNWCPTLKLFVYYGNHKEREKLRMNLREMKEGVDFNVILTTYNILFAPVDRGFLKRYKYSYMILDEAQYIKNSDSKRYKNIFKISSKHRLLLTGTPLQNNLLELWSLLYFLMPHIFGDTQRDNELLNQLLGYQGDNTSVITKMKKILSPFILRRLKTEVSGELKPKIETIEQCEFTEFQRQCYDKVVSRTKKEWEKSRDTMMNEEQDKKKTNKRKKHTLLMDAEEEGLDLDMLDIGEKGGGKGKPNRAALISNILMQLRKVANHPLLSKRCIYTPDRVSKMVDIAYHKVEDFKDYQRNEVVDLFDSYSDFDLHLTCLGSKHLSEFLLEEKDFIESSTKVMKLLELLDHYIHVERSKVLIFSQMTKMLDILELVLEIKGIRFARLDGKTKVTDRQSIIDYFSNDPDVSVFLLSTNAGGLGINLTCANVVIFYDNSFNPQNDRQAEDRAHRLGQTKEVKVHKLIVKDTVDSDILRCATEKKKLNDHMLEEGTFDQTNESKLESKTILKMLDSIFSN